MEGAVCQDEGEKPAMCKNILLALNILRCCEESDLLGNQAQST